jgi:hypothetical protein
LYNVCNEIFYFSICEGVLWFGKQQSTVVGNTIRLQFETVSKQTAAAVISGIVLYKGQLNDGKEIFGTKTVLWFDPKREHKCTNGNEISELDYLFHQ